MHLDWTTVASLATAAGTLVLAITRFGLMPRDDQGWLLTAGRYWNVDRPDPRDRPR